MIRSNTPLKIIGIDGRELLGDRITGIGRYLRNFLEFALTNRPNHKFILYGNQNTKADFAYPNLEIKISAEGNTLYWDHVLLARHISRDRVDVFFSPFDKAPLLSAVPSVITIHDLLFDIIRDEGYGNRYLYNTIYMLLRRKIAEKARLIITDSYHSKSDIMQKLGIPENKIRVVYIGVAGHFRPIDSKESIKDLKERYGIRKDYILYVGNFKRHKNVECLIRSFALLPQNLQRKYDLVLGGYKGEDGIYLARLCKELQLEDKVIFTGFIPEKEMPVLYSGAYVFVFPSLYEGFGLPPLEAMACGTPVICSNRTSLPEVVGDSGMLIDASKPEYLSEAMKTLLLDADLREDFRVKGLRRAQEFLPELTSGKLLDAVDEVLESTSKG